MAKKEDENNTDEILESYEYTYSYKDNKGNDQTESVNIRPWNMFSAPKNFKLMGQILKDIRNERPDVGFSNIVENLDVILSESSEPAFQLLKNSLPRDLNEQSKQRLMENTHLVGALELLEAVIKLNFFHPELGTMMKSLFGLLENVSQ